MGAVGPAGHPAWQAPLAWAARAGRMALDLVVPARCIKCGAVVEGGALCPSCWSELSFLGPPCCAACGYPFDYDPGEGALCAGCLRAPPDYDRARAALVYDETSGPLVVRFKHADRTETAGSFALLMTRAGSALIAASDLVVPVPLHRRRLLLRRYNQAALLSLRIAADSGLPCQVDALRRTRNTPSQARLGATARARNVRGAFAVRRERAAALAGRRVLLVDDVLTTGATANACARALRAGGATSVSVLTLARVVRPAAG